MAEEDLIKVLCVDDEPRVLDGLRRHMRRRFDVHTAESGAQGLRALDKDGPFAVVVSDLRMPGMDGIEFLGKVRELAPETTRILLTGNADLDSAMAAVNQGNIFRFLGKPCPRENLLASVEAAAEHNRLVTAERVLLEQTLHGSIQMLTEILSLANPTAFGRATRAKHLAGNLAQKLGQPVRWQMEMAAMLSQVGCIALPAQTVNKLYLGEELDVSEQAMVNRLPEMAVQLLAPIPRIEEVREILHYQDKHFDGSGPPDEDVHGSQIPMGSRILRVVLDLDVLKVQGVPLAPALETLHGRTGWYDAEVLTALGESGGDEQQREVVELYCRELRTGMTFVDDVEAEDGRLIVGHGQDVSVSLLERLRNFSDNVGIKEPVRVMIHRG